MFVLIAIKAFLKLIENNDYYTMLNADKQINDNFNLIKRVRNDVNLMDIDKNNQTANSQSTINYCKSLKAKYYDAIIDLNYKSKYFLI